MSRRYLQHPFLKNPVKWLKGVPKKHKPELYQESFYDTRNISMNPFVRSLEDTRHDVSRARFPLGNMIQIVVSGSREKNDYTFRPVFQKPVCGQNPASYIINSKSYITFLNRKRLAPVPSKFKHKSPFAIGAIRSPEDLASDIFKIFRGDIENMLQKVNVTPEKIEKSRMIIIKPGKLEEVLFEGNSEFTIYTSTVRKEIAISFDEHPELAFVLVRFAVFNTV